VSPAQGKSDQKRSEGGDRPTVRDVAAVAGVSFKTVSRVINGEPSVRPETAARVMAAVRELRFRPNVIAADFARGGSRNHIGLIIDDVSNPFWARLTRAIEDVVTADGLRVIIASSDFDPEREHHIIDGLVAQRLGGLLIVPVGGDHSYLAREMELGTAIVFLDRPQTNLEADNVTLDDYGGARAAAEHLLAHGHRHIGVLMQSMRIYTMTERHRGFTDALRDAAVDIDADLTRQVETVEEARTATAELLAGETPPTALFCANNRMSVGAVSALGADGGRIAVVGFDDLELAEALATPLTVVRTDGAELGKAGAELLVRRMRGWSDEPQRIILPTTLIARGSGEISPS
jgi:LacI family transcriptional regulator